MASGTTPVDLNRAFNCLVRKAAKKDELVFSLFRKSRIFATAYLTTKNDLRPFRCRLRVNDLDTYMQPKDFLASIKKAKQLVLVQDSATQGIRKELEVLFSGSHPVWDRPCRFCLLRGVVKFPRRPIRYGTDEICMECAKSQLIKEAQSRGWRVTDATIDYLGRILERTGDCDPAWRILSPDYDVEKDSHLSLYDVIQKKPSTQASMGIDEITRLYDDPENAEIFVRKLKETGIKSLLPVQVSAVEKGLLKGRNLLIVSSTSSGKTLIAEMAGIPRATSKRKFVYLTPLVALANLRYFEFTHKYRDLGLRTAIKVGVGRIRTGRKLKLNTNIQGSDIMVGTYEGVEQMLRSGSARQLGEIGVIAIDEIQNLADEDRGSRLDGLIKKLVVLCPSAQFLYLSATVGNPQELASKLRASLVLHDERPIPLERHVIPISAPGQKIRLMSSLIRKDFGSISTEGYKGQTIVFTNSRRKCHQLSSSLSTQSAPVQAYHSGLSYERRRATEAQFMEQRIAAVVTTAALAAGVDLPASQVIFETLAMGMEWITPTEFHQMLGRAGRLGFHGSGKAMMLIEPGRSFSRAEKRTEDQVVMDLLSSKIDPVRPSYTQEDLTEQVLADASTFGMLTINEMDRLQDYSVGFSSSMKPLIDKLLRTGMLRRKGRSLVITPIGRIASSFFLSGEESSYMIKSIKKGLPALIIVIGTRAFDRVYLSEKLQKQIERSSRRKTSIRFFDSDVLEILAHPRRVSSPWFRDIIGRITTDLLRCRCKGSPHCDCPPRKLSEIILQLRISGLNPEKISAEVYKRYGIEAYPGDVLEYLNNAVRLSEAVSRFSDVLKRQKLANDSHELCAKIIG